MYIPIMWSHQLPYSPAAVNRPKRRFAKLLHEAARNQAATSISCMKTLSSRTGWS